jgi:glycosyltransferase involved in cell wall biosynthesis
MRIAILTQYYPPEMGAPQSRLSDLARRLAERGHRVQVLTALPNYPGTEILEGYRGKPVVQEERDGVPVARVWLFVPRRKTFWFRLLNYGSFALHAAWRGRALLKPADFLITESPPLFAGPAGAYLARRLGARFVFNVSDLWPDSAVELGFLRDGLALRLARRLEAWCYARADAITCQSESIAASIRNRVPGKPVGFLPNGVDISRWKGKQRREEVRRGFGWEPEDFVVGYAGLHGHAQALEQVLEAAGLLANERRVRFAFFGEGPCKQALELRAYARALGRVTFHPPLPHERMPELYSAFDAGLVPLARGLVFEGVLPSKLFEVMASGKPVLVAGGGEVEKLVERAGCGVAVPPEAPEALAGAVRRLAGSPELCSRFSGQGKAFVAEQFDRASVAIRCEEFLCSLLPGTFSSCPASS